VGSCSVGSCPGAIDPTNIGVCLPPVPEICDNGLDDDNDGLIDCADPDCIGQGNCAATTWTCSPGYYAATDAWFEARSALGSTARGPVVDRAGGARAEADHSRDELSVDEVGERRPAGVARVGAGVGGARAGSQPTVHQRWGCRNLGQLLERD